MHASPLQDLELGRARTLRRARITYAATVAWACRELYLRFQSLGLLAAPAATPQT